MKPMQTSQGLRATDVDGKNGTVTGQWKKPRLARNDVRYWAKKVTKRSYRTPEGAVVEIPEWQWRCRKGGDTWFNLGTANRESAATRAQEIALHIDAHTLAAAIEKYKRTEAKRDITTVAQFADLYREAAAGFRKPPSRYTIEHYVAIVDLTSDKVKEFKLKYSKERSPTSVAARLRIGSAMFSKQAISHYAKAALTVINPFAEHRTSVKVESYTALDKPIMDRIWSDAAALKATSPAAYAIFLMEIGLGLRRNETDKAAKCWLTESGGRRWMTIPSDIAKSGISRKLPVSERLYSELMEVAPAVSPYIVPGGLPFAKSTSKAIVYRCEDAHRFLVAWLRERGVAGLKPCHMLRKQFGSEIASTFGIFHAQKFLGHQDPKLTSDYYAAQLDAPEINHLKFDQLPAKVTTS